MLQQFPYPVIEKHLSKTDSLQQSINALNQRIHTLEIAVNKTEIASGFFSEIITTNLTIFVGIISLSALISWGFIGGMLSVHKGKTEKAINTKLLEQEARLQSDNNKLREQVSITIYDANRAMFHIAVSKKQHFAAFKWALFTAVSVKDAKKDYSLIKLWISAAQKELKLVKLGNPSALKHMSVIIEKLDDLEFVVDEDGKKILSNLRAKFFLVAYSPEQPPADIMKD